MSSLMDRSSTVIRLYSTVLASHSVPRQRIYGLLLEARNRTWTISEIATLVPEVSVEAVRSTLYLLMGEQFVEAVPRQRNLTLCLTHQGRLAITAIVANWAATDNGLGQS